MIRAVGAVLVGLALLPGCTETPAQRSPGGVKVNTPGVNVDVGTPNAPSGVKVKTPRVDVEVGK